MAVDKVMVEDGDSPDARALAEDAVSELPRVMEEDVALVGLPRDMAEDLGLARDKVMEEVVVMEPA